MTEPEDELIETFENEGGPPVEVEYIRGMKVTDTLSEGMKQMSDHLEATEPDWENKANRPVKDYVEHNLKAVTASNHRELMEMLTMILVQQTRIYDLMASDMSSSSNKHMTMGLHAQGRFLTDPPIMAEDAWKEDNE